CATCLGRHKHRVFDCDATHTWNKAFEVMSKRSGKDFMLKDGRSLCYDWQRGRGCRSSLHDNRHICSGCGKATHGAQNCPRAEPLTPSNPVPGKRVGETA
ncbi:uncharacterized protein C8Q71DRAFT_717584, partial [Rhodofomes roseus]